MTPDESGSNELTPSWGKVLSSGVSMIVMLWICAAVMALSAAAFPSEDPSMSYWEAVRVWFPGLFVIITKVGLVVVAVLSLLRVAFFARLTLTSDSMLVYAPVLGTERTLSLAELSRMERTSKTTRGRRGRRHTSKRIQFLDGKGDVALEFDPDLYATVEVEGFVELVQQAMRQGRHQPHG